MRQFYASYSSSVQWGRFDHTNFSAVEAIYQQLAASTVDIAKSTAMVIASKADDDSIRLSTGYGLQLAYATGGER